jgi:hypothetical protein
MRKKPEQTRRIAVMRVYGQHYDPYGDGYSSEQCIVQHVTKFEEISEADFWEFKDALNSMTRHGSEYYLIVEDVTSPVLIANTINEYREKIARQKKEQEKAAEKLRLHAEEAKRKREEKKLAKLVKDKEKFKKMAAEMGLTVVEPEQPK